ncbi:MAG: hypothetical protein Q9165_008688 [Trypethelium subeluteriae]
MTSSDSSEGSFSIPYGSEAVSTTQTPATSSSRRITDDFSTVTVTVTTSISASLSEEMTTVTAIPTTITHITTLVTKLHTPYTGTVTSVCTTVLVAGNALPTYASGKCGRVLAHMLTELAPILGMHQMAFVLCLNQDNAHDDKALAKSTKKQSKAIPSELE